MDVVRSLIAAHEHGDAGSLQALGVALAAVVHPVAALPVDPVELYNAVEDRPAVEPGTWQVVVDARDTGDLTDAEFTYLSAAVDALLMEDDDVEGS